MIPIDLHTHTIAGGHGTVSTIDDLARAAAEKGMTALGISDHGPATPGACSESYFRSLGLAPKRRHHIRLLYGAEANILDETGRLDLPDRVLAGLDFVIAAIHRPCFHPTQDNCRQPETAACSKPPKRMDRTHPQDSVSESSSIPINTEACINAMANPYVKILGHPDDTAYPLDAERVVAAAVKYRVFLEVNEASLAPGGYRGDTRQNMCALLMLCLQYQHPVLLSSDGHGHHKIGEAPYALSLLRETGFPQDLIYNFRSSQEILSFRSR